MLGTLRIGLALAAAAAAAAPVLAATGARELFERASERERAVRTILTRGAPDAGLVTKARPVIASYERLVRQHPRSGYCDNALWQGAELAAELWRVFGHEQDRRLAVRLYAWLVREYPASPFVVRARTARRQVESSTLARKAPAAGRRRPEAPRPAAAVRAEPPPTVAVVSATPPPVPAAVPPTVAGLPLIRDIRRTVLPNAVRVIVEIDAEVPFRQERIADPDRVFIDLQGVRPAPDLRLPQHFEDGLIRQIRLGHHPDDTVRVVLDLERGARHSVFALYSPYRLIIDCQTTPDPAVQLASRTAPPPLPSAPVEIVDAPPLVPDGTTGVSGAEQAPTTPPTPLARRAPSGTVPVGPPAANLRGRFSLSRQLGLGISRIVIDPGHGGKDPGARSKNLTEADVVLDVALRLEQLLIKQEGVEVVLTRRSDVYVPLEERTAIANREDADLFLSIHANASRNKEANGIETYFLNFATTPDAEAVAARENAASGQTMHRLPDIVKAITLNNKLAESRDFATFVQRAMIERVRGSNRHVRDLGVKQAPFVVLIGAGMPSVLAEISFLTHAQEGRLLQTPAYRQRLAEALLAGILRYQNSLKTVRVAQRD